MKFSIVKSSCIFLCMEVLSSFVSAFTVSMVPLTKPSLGRIAASTTTTGRNMFSGAGAGLPSEDNPEELAKLEQAAKSMGMTLEEYKLGISARLRLSTELDAARVTAGKTNIVTVVRDGNNPPKYLDISITEEGKKIGSKALGDELVKALKMASELSRTKRSEAQRSMMAFIGDEMKKIGSS